MSLLDEFMAACTKLGARPPRCILHQLEPDPSFVEILRIRRVTLTPEVCSALSLFIPRLPNLERIDLQGSIVSYRALEPICEALCSMAQTHPCFELNIDDEFVGPRINHMLERLYLSHDGINIIVGGMPHHSFPSRSISFRSTRLPTPTSSSSESLQRSRPSSFQVNATCDNTEDTELETRIADQLERLCSPLRQLEEVRRLAVLNGMLNEECAARAAIKAEETEDMESLRMAHSFEMPFRPPRFDTYGPLCSSLDVAELHPGDDDVQPLEAELLRLKQRLFVLEDALRRHQESLPSKAGDDERVTIDGRPLRRRLRLPDETLEEAAARLKVSPADLLMINDTLENDGWVLVPLSLDDLLLEQLTAERAQAIRAAEAASRLKELRLMMNSSADDLAKQEALASEAALELRVRGAQREQTQAALRHIEMALYERKRDGWLRFLKHQRALLADYEVLSSHLFVEYLDGMDAFRRQHTTELNGIHREIERQRRILVPDEVELRALKQRWHALKHRLASCGATETNSYEDGDLQHRTIAVQPKYDTERSNGIAMR